MKQSSTRPKWCVTLLQDVAVVHGDGGGVCGSAVQDQTCGASIGEAGKLKVKETHSDTSPRQHTLSL